MVKLRVRLVKSNRTNFTNTSKNALESVALPAQRLPNNTKSEVVGTPQTSRCVVRMKRVKENSEACTQKNQLQLHISEFESVALPAERLLNNKNSEDAGTPQTSRCVVRIKRIQENSGACTQKNQLKQRTRLVKSNKANFRNTSKSPLENVALTAERLLNNKNSENVGTLQTSKCAVRIKRLKENSEACTQKEQLTKKTSFTLSNSQRINSVKNVQFIERTRREFTQSKPSQNVNAFKMRSLKQARPISSTPKQDNIQRKPEHTNILPPRSNALDASQINTTTFKPLQNSTIYRHKNHKAFKNPDISSAAARDETEKLECSTQNVCNEKMTAAKGDDRNKARKTKKTGKQKEAQRRSNRKSKGVFDFQSESPTSDSGRGKHADPAADIIQRMINNGKVSVATLIKGRGKTRLKNVKKKKLMVRPIGKRKTCSLQEAGTQAALTTAAPLPLMPAMSPIYEMDSDCHDCVQDNPENNTMTSNLLPDISKQIGLQDNNNLHGKPKGNTMENFSKAALTTAAPLSPMPAMSPIYEMDSDCHDYVQDNPENNTLTSNLLPDYSKQIRLQDNNNLHGKPKGDTMENISPSELVNRLKKSKHKITDPRKLLYLARKIVSTPENKKASIRTENANSLHSTILSPIALLTNHKKTPANSPWRVPDDALLPNTFVFGLNDSNLPSYSSDFIPSTPHRQRNNVDDPKSIEPALAIPVPLNNEPAVFTESVLPSTSDASNMRQEPQDFNTNDSNGENIAPRSPLAKKTRDISLKKGQNANESENQENEDFVHLPNPRRTLQYRSPLKAINILEVVLLPSWKQDAAANENITTNKTTTEKHYDQQTTKEKENLFGFDDFLCDTQSVSTKRYSGPQANNNCNLHEQLHNLREIRPPNDEIPLPVKIPVRYRYDGFESSGSRQRTIKELLCSTMIHPEANLNNLRKDETSAANQTTDNLFTDLDPETTFDDKQSHRTYIRPKRKRKQRHEFLLFHDSDVSEDEEDSRDKSEDNQACKTHKQKKKKTKKENVDPKALNEFVTSFNAICKEVEQFELMVE